MSLFRREPRPVLPAEILNLLPDLGRALLAARLGGPSVSDDQRFSWDRMWGPVSRALFGETRDQAIGELYEATISSPDREMATLGAYGLIVEFLPESEDHRYLSLLDETLGTLRTRRVTSMYLSGFETERWVAVHGELRSSYDGLFAVEVPTNEDLPEPKPLEVGASRMLALTHPLPDGNGFFAEHRGDGVYLVYSERIHSSDDPRRVRCEEDQLGTFTSLKDLMRALAEMFGSPPHWSDDDLEDYFPQRGA
jgi:hypothetical protein